jgi:hypothetical protein
LHEAGEHRRSREGRAQIRIGFREGGTGGETDRVGHDRLSTGGRPTKKANGSGEKEQK